jgi:hypothetical protein
MFPFTANQFARFLTHRFPGQGLLHIVCWFGKLVDDGEISYKGNLSEPGGARRQTVTEREVCLVYSIARSIQASVLRIDGGLDVRLRESE